MSVRIIAFDPGSSGGVAELFTDGSVVAFGMLEDAELRDYIEASAKSARTEGARLVAFMEIVGGFIHSQHRPGGNSAPGSTMFKFGDGNGYIRGLIDAARIERIMVRPQVWQTGIPGVKGQKEKTVRKNAMKAHASRLFPTLKVTLKTADALCLADYGRRWLALPPQWQPPVLPL